MKADAPNKIYIIEKACEWLSKHFYDECCSIKFQ